MRRKRLIVLFGIVCAFAAVTAGLLASLGTAGQTRASKSYKVFFLPKFIGIPVFTQNGLGAKEAARKLGDKVTYNGPTEASATKQVTFIDSAVRQGYKGIIISADDPNATAPALKRARARGLKVVSYDADTQSSARTIYVSPPSAKDVGYFEIEWLGSQIGYKGQIAILSAAATAANQNAWIKFMKQALRTKKYRGMKLVKVAYGNDNDTQSAQQTQSLLQAYPKLKGIIAPTTVGVAAAARVISQAKKCSAVRVTGLGLPSQMRTYVKSGCVKKFGLWNVVDLGYVAAYTADAVLAGKITGKAGQSFRAGKAGHRTDGKKGVVIRVPPFAFTKRNIDKFHF